MKIIDRLHEDRLSLSFEVFPPKTDTAFESVKHATEEIAKLHPSFMSVTYGAGGGTSRYTLDIAKNIKANYGVPTLAHLTCVSSTKDTVHARIADIKEAGIQNIMALRGDIPAGLENADRSHWDYHHAIELIRELKESGTDLCIGGACYPEIHPESTNQKEDIKYLKERLMQGVNFLPHRCFLITICYIISFIRFAKRVSPCPSYPVLCPSPTGIKWKELSSCRGPLCRNASRPWWTSSEPLLPL